MALQTPPQTSFMPIVDLEGTRRDRRRRAEAAEHVQRAAGDTGFFYVANHGVANELTERAFRNARRFFALPDAEKLERLMVRGQSRGYEPLNYQTLDAKTASDLKESFQLGADTGAEHPQANDDTPNLAPNPWPGNLPGFREAILSYHAAVCDLAAHLMSIVALSLALPEDVFEASYRGANPSLRLLHYPPRPADAHPAQIGAGAHTDWGGITILAQDDTGGLEVRDTSGAWIRATPIRGTFVVNLGDLIVRWTNDRYHSTPHRVFNPAADRDRYSMALFFSPNSRARIECLPTCVRPGEPPRYAVCTAGEHIAERRRETYGIA